MNQILTLIIFIPKTRLQFVALYIKNIYQFTFQVSWDLVQV